MSLNTSLLGILRHTVQVAVPGTLEHSSINGASQKNKFDYNELKAASEINNSNVIAKKGFVKTTDFPHSSILQIS